MKYFAGIVPPSPVYETFLRIQKQFGDNRVEPHITLRPPVKPHDEEKWLQIVTKIAATTKPFTVTLPNTDYFGNGVLFASVLADALIALHKELITALAPFENEENDADTHHFHPHLTLGRKWCGFTTDNFENMQQLANEYLIGKNISFKATHIRIYQKPEHQGRWQAFRDAPFLTI
ncbi:2'-5' RNA ligase family protein [Mucilaginibacter lacusdianchii]|uniref:2'-5' RNA ligase family protein n=1 Tax=Mucilaginibacter lacusdianchii TaxID=2684211 RepID=UPI00131B535A|nr:2'-5' RNA ligase family protein [Mucilaginibacter sp. JXJ CY 39]